MPTAESLPQIQSGFVVSNEGNGPYGAKKASETAMIPKVAAIANRQFFATLSRNRIQTLPITLKDSS